MLKELRVACGFKRQAEFCKALGEKQSTVATWETGRSKPDIITTTKIAEVLGVTTDEVIACFVK